MPRPTKLTSQVEALILESLRKGNTRTAAFESAGVHRSKISVWLARFATFRDAVTRAEAEAEVTANGALHDAYQAGDWRAAFAWLERRRAAEWGKVDRLEIEIRRTAERIAGQTGADPDWLVKRAAEIVAGETGGGAVSGEHRVVLGLHSKDSWFARCSRCDWAWEGTSPDAMREAAETHGEVVPGGYLPRAYVEALVLDMMSPPDESGAER